MSFLRSEFGLEFPLIVAPMAGGPSSVDLVAASSNAGALGSVGAAYSTPADLREFVAGVRARTSKPFAINLFVPTPLEPISDSRRNRALAVIDAYRREFGLPAATLAPPYAEEFAPQFQTVLDLEPAALSFVFGRLTPEQTARAKAKHVFLIGTASSEREAVALEASGCDAVVLQGVEAGGHRGIFDATAEDPRIGTMDLVNRCKARVRIPLVAAGGLMTAEHVRRALDSGASAVQMGTAFLACEEAGTSRPYRRALLDGSRTTRVTRVYSGRLARGLENRFMNEVEAMGPKAVLPFPAQNELTRELRLLTANAGSAEFLSLWAGAGEGDLWQGSAADLIPTLFQRAR